MSTSNPSVRVIIAGGRDYRFTDHDKKWLEDFFNNNTVTEVVTGGAPGADSEGHAWAKSQGYQTKVFKAEWDKHGNKAGPLRNEKMAKYVSTPSGEGKEIPVCILFPGGAGTASMTRLAGQYGLVKLHPGIENPVCLSPAKVETAPKNKHIFTYIIGKSDYQNYIGTVKGFCKVLRWNARNKNRVTLTAVIGTSMNQEDVDHLATVLNECRIAAEEE